MGAACGKTAATDTTTAPIQQKKEVDTTAKAEGLTAEVNTIKLPDDDQVHNSWSWNCRVTFCCTGGRSGVLAVYSENKSSIGDR